MRRQLALALCVASTSLADPRAALRAQQSTTVAGTVVDDGHRPLADVSIEVGDTFLRTVTRGDGRFELTVPAGSWTIRFRRLGYAPAALGIATDTIGRALPLDVVLIPAVHQLTGLVVTTDSAATMSHRLTTTTVRQAPPLAEPDIFRAIVLLPGVSQPNDLKGRIHLAGGASDETGVRLDGHPLQDPFHLLGVLGAFNVAALEQADVRIHHLPASFDGRLSGLIDLESRAPRSGAAGEGVVSLLSSSLTYGSNLPAGVDVLASGRITYLDRIFERLPSRIRGSDGAWLPRYHDLLLRIGAHRSPVWRIEALGFDTRDQLRRTSQEGVLPDRRPLTWGESLLGVRALTSVGRWSLAARASTNQATVERDRGTADRPDWIDTERLWMSAGVEAARRGAHRQLRIGATVDARRFTQRWEVPDVGDETFSPNTPRAFAGRQRQSVASIFGDASTRLGPDVSISLGSGVVFHDGRAHPAPRALLAWQGPAGLQLEAAYGRRHQFDAQLEEPLEGSVTPPLFLIERPRIADVVGVKAALRPSTRPLALDEISVQGFAKRYEDQTVARSAMDPSTSTGLPDFDRVDGSAWGALAMGRWSPTGASLIQLSYGYTRSFNDLGGKRVPNPWDAPHDLGAFASISPWTGWTFNAAYMLRSGNATTPVQARIFAPDAGIGPRLPARYLEGETNGIHLPAYERLDVGVRRMWRGGGAEWTLFLQAVNVLGRRNYLEYDWFSYFRAAQGFGEDLGRTGLPLLPSIGLEVRW